MIILMKSPEVGQLLETLGSRILTIDGEEWFNLPYWYKKLQGEDYVYQEFHPEHLPENIKNIVNEKNIVKEKAVQSKEISA